MSHLTKEDEALVESYKGEPGIYGIVRRLSARVEEMESNLNKTIAAHIETQKWWGEDLKQLNSLLSVMEDVLLLANLNVLGGWVCIPVGEWGNIRRNLDSAIKKIKGEK